MALRRSGTKNLEVLAAVVLEEIMSCVLKELVKFKLKLTFIWSRKIRNMINLEKIAECESGILLVNLSAFSVSNATSESHMPNGELKFARTFGEILCT